MNSASALPPWLLKLGRGVGGGASEGSFSRRLNCHWGALAAPIILMSYRKVTNILRLFPQIRSYQG